MDKFAQSIMAENKTIGEIKEGLTRLQDTRIYLEVTLTTVKRAIARTYQPELIKNYYIEELTPTKEGGFVVKFVKRFQPLTEEEYQKEYWGNMKLVETNFDLKEWINKRISAEKTKKEEALDVGSKASIGGKIRSLNEVLEYINQQDGE